MYEILLSSSAVKDYRKIPDKDLDRINTAIDSLANTPRPKGCRKLTGREAWRIRIGNY